MQCNNQGYNICEPQVLAMNHISNAYTMFRALVYESFTCMNTFKQNLNSIKQHVL
jgi:hypothetical protein